MRTQIHTRVCDPCPQPRLQGAVGLGFDAEAAAEEERKEREARWAAREKEREERAARERREREARRRCERRVRAGRSSAATGRGGPEAHMKLRNPLRLPVLNWRRRRRCCHKPCTLEC